MTSPQLVHRGGHEGVTGSCHQLWLDAEHSVLIDCGAFQGTDHAEDEQERLALGFPVDGIKALIVTHVHLDHVGRIPNLLAAGFDGPILCSEPSARLLPIVLEDAFRLAISRDPEALERYLNIIEQRIIALPYGNWFTLHGTPAQGCQLRLQPAGHVLGSAYVELQLNEEGSHQRVVFSGDLGASYSPLLPDLEAPEQADLLILESTYGDRCHEDRRHRRERLQAVIERALADQGTVLIPSFCIGRTQDLLYELEAILHERCAAAETSASTPGTVSSAPDIDWPDIPIILDSPLAGRFTQVYKELRDFWDAPARQRVEQEGRKPFSFKQLVIVDDHAEHERIVRHLADTARPAIVIAGNGMCAGGRIVRYLKTLLGDPRHNVVFVGHQVKGTPGHDIQTHGPEGGYVMLEGERVDIRAGVDSVGGYSAHADQADLVGWVTRMAQWPTEIRLIHGEPHAKQCLADLLHRHYQAAGRQARIEIPHG
jgi:metallo-beta-lactamase family protein